LLVDALTAFLAGAAAFLPAVLGVVDALVAGFVVVFAAVVLVAGFAAVVFVVVLVAGFVVAFTAVFVVFVLGAEAALVPAAVRGPAVLAVPAARVVAAPLLAAAAPLAGFFAEVPCFAAITPSVARAVNADKWGRQ
jgi:hypothetical protein